MSKDRILVLEDEKDTAFVMNHMLLKAGKEVKIVSNGKEGLEVIDDFNPKVIVADWNMPVMSGLEFTKELRKIDKYKSIYLIMLTGRASVNERVTGLDAGADDYLTKPIENLELIARINSGIRIYDLQSELKKVEHTKAILEMACTIGHKFNNPLASLVLGLDSLLDDLNSDAKEKHLEDIEIINTAINRIKKLTHELTKLDDPQITEYLDDRGMLDIGD
ncbi:MAG: DNA-binding response regulator [Ignavibacteria bacterium]|nr:MAG: DNA-binding response regulator [Ignavibacteria bacterium]